MTRRSDTTETPISRRFFVGATAASALAMSTQTSQASNLDDEEFEYEVTRTDAEWREMLSDDEYKILRKGSTEIPRTSPLWEESRPGLYHCKGCGLTSFDGRWKILLSKGWAFFEHSQKNAVLTDIDGPVAEYGVPMNSGPGAYMEIHCRRCGSHLGHLLHVEGMQLHCINGTALDFRPESA